MLTILLKSKRSLLYPEKERSFFLIDIKGDKIWIQYDGTEVGVANELIELGIPKKSIVLGFQDPNARKFTEFAVN